MRSYKIVVSYDGTAYCGWQWQPDGCSIDRIMRETFLSVFKQEQVFFVGASRTDAGVHAYGQVLRLRTQLSDSITPQKLLTVWNDALPEDIVIREIIPVPDTFHPQHDIKKKVYEYTVFLRRPLPQQQRFGWFFRFPIHSEKLVRCLATFVGTHDFRAFCKESSDVDTVRTIDTITVERTQEGDGYKIIVVGTSFLRHMIRRMVGAAVTVASRDSLTESDITMMLLSKKIIKMLPVAPAKGLCLKEIHYKDKGMG